MNFVRKFVRFSPVPRGNLLRGRPYSGVGGGGAEAHELPDEVHLARVARDVNQIIARCSIPIHVAVVGVAAVAGAAVLEVHADARRPDAEEIALAAHGAEHPLARGELRVPRCRIAYVDPYRV